MLGGLKPHSIAKRKTLNEIAESSRKAWAPWLCLNLRQVSYWDLQLEVLEEGLNACICSPRGGEGKIPDTLPEGGGESGGTR